MKLTLTAEDLDKVRFTVSPLWEAVTSLRTLQSGTPIHRSWIAQAKSRMAASPDPEKADHLRLLTALVPGSGFLPDSLTPTPRRQDTLASGLAAIAAVPHEMWRTDIGYLLANLPDGDAADTARAFVDDLDAGIPRLLRALEWYWATTLEPFWPRLRAIELADVDYRLALLAAGGMQEMFSTLHPSVRRIDTGLEVTQYCDCTDCPEPGNGLLLVPSAFVWPRTLVLNTAPFVPTLTYAPRGVGRLWENGKEVVDSPVAQLLGRTRAQILAQLDLPMTTTQLACALDLAAGTVSGHLKVMAATGLAEPIRAGREVFYRRAEVGEGLLARA
ncbi:winged helix-turn-helix domain-containing protein [Specibacter cremeus]|uniref:winged helix-turn-helix domain-containing protein n=1 Tax=Specibacter cremeus TaxID=1629051 RepID=UPI0013DE0CBA|nr:winged helix-turn-helix domain-containing protein [Specibacter cremeus]